MPRVSVVMAVHNEEDAIVESVRSILAQTYADLELIVVDDGSTDRSAALLASIPDSRLHVLTNPVNVGLTASLNRGIETAQGEFVARQDADDRSAPERLDAQIALLDAQPSLGLCGTWAALADADGRRFAVERPPVNHDALVAALSVSNPFIHGTLTVRRALLAELGGYREEFRLAQDYDLLLRARTKTRLVTVPRVIYEYRFRPASMTASRYRLQQAYAALARTLAQERVSRGRDALDDGLTAEELLVFDDSREAEARYHRHVAHLFWMGGDLASSRRELVRALRLRPLDWGAAARLVLSLGGSRAARAAETARRRLRRELGRDEVST